MIFAKNKLIAAMREIPGMHAMRSSAKAALTSVHLPLITFDYGDFQYAPYTENGKVYKVDPAYVMSLFVKEILDEELQDDELNKWWDLVIDKLIEKFPGFKIIGQAVGYVPVNNTTTYAAVCLLYITSYRHAKQT